MNIEIENYNKQIHQWPEKGNHIMAQYNNNEIIVYQAYRNEIGLFAAENQFFGGEFKVSRMTWIKPNFLWMMYRNGWGHKEGQEITLAIHLKLEAFEKYLEEAILSTFHTELFDNYESWQLAVRKSDARLQWDPDHDPFGKPLARRAIQIGLRNDLIMSYSRDDILQIENISEFVNEQYEYVKSQDLDGLKVPIERPLLFKNKKLNEKLQIE